MITMKDNKEGPTEVTPRSARPTYTYRWFRKNFTPAGQWRGFPASYTPPPPVHKNRSKKWRDQDAQNQSGTDIQLDINTFR